jgi:hypothetical protein
MKRLTISIPIPDARVPRLPRPSSRLARGGWLAALALAAAFALFAAQDGAQSAGANSITSPDMTDTVGTNSSLALDNKGLPVVSYYDGSNADLKVLHCNDANCVGGDDSITSPDMANAGTHTSLALDAMGFPVVSYRDVGTGDLKVLHCNDPDCAGGGESITSPDTASNAEYTSIALDAVGFPVISYWDSAGSNLKVLHCDDVNCAGVESPSSPDTAGSVGQHTSLALDAAGFPVVSYHDFDNGNLKVLHCNDANCAGSESPTAPDTNGVVGLFTSLALDVAGRPVVSYWDLSNDDLKVLHCNDVNCVGMENCAGGESPVSVDATAFVGYYTSLALDPSGRPVVSYFDFSNLDLKLAHCGTPLCANSPATREIRIASRTAGWAAGPMGGGCYTVDPLSADPTFVVCDNGGVTASAACVTGFCQDSDPTAGSIVVEMITGFYDVTAQSTPGHTPDPHLKSCNPSVSFDAKCAFTHIPRTRPWFPWDVNGDGAIASADFNQVLQRFGQTK